MKSTVQVFIGLLLVLHTTTAASGTVLYVTPTLETPCPAKPCHTLSQYAHNVSEYITTDTTFVFLPGDHSLDTDFNISDISSLAIVGNTSSFPRLTSRVVCSNTDAMVAIANVSLLSITALEVLSCGQNNVERVSVRVHTVENFRLSSFHLSYSSPLHIYNSAAWLGDNSFANNTGTGCGGSLKTEQSNVTFTGTNSFVQNHCRGYGGGMCVISSTLFGNGSVSFVGNNVTQDGGGLFSKLSIVTFTGKIVFEGNYAKSSGGGFAVKSSSQSYFSGNCSFISNSCYAAGGAIYSSGLLNFTGESIFLNNSVNSYLGWGGGIHCIKYTMFTGTTSFLGNTASVGGGLLSYGCKIIGKLTVKRNSVTLGSSGFLIFGPLYIAGDVKVSNNINGGGIAILPYGTDITDSELHGNFLFENNTADDGAGLRVSDSQLTVSGNFTFRNNTAYNTGGGLLLNIGATLHLLSNTTMLFIGNSANKGGAIWVHDVNPFLYCIPKEHLARRMLDDCFFQVPANYSDIHLQFEYNYAAVAGSDIYGGLIDKCKAKYHEDSSKIFDAITENSALWISSPPYKICYCSSEQQQCSSYKATPYILHPGQSFGLSLTTIGQGNGFAPSRIQVVLDDGLSLGNCSQELQQTTSQHVCSHLQYTLLSSSDAVGKQLGIHLYAAEPCGTADTITPLSLYIEMNKCPPGFELQPPGSCKCDKRLQNYSVTCDINDQSITTTGSVWVGYDSSYRGLIIHSHCPTHYCKEGTVSFTLNSTDLQCAHNRSGLLCGACQEGLSLKLGSAQCGRCKDTYLLLFVAFAIAGIALVVLLLVLRLTVTHGTINGLIFYMNVFQSKNDLFLPNNQCIALKVFLAWLNLNFGINSCLYDGLTTYQNTWLQFLFPAYIWILIGLVICISRWSSWVTRRLGTNPVAVLATLVLLSYNKILQTIITVFSPTELHYTNNSKLVWLYDGNITFLEEEHIPLFVTSLLVLLVLILPYTLLLLFGQCLQANSNLFIFSWVNRPAFKYFLDNSHAPYQDKHRYWTGLMLMARVVLLAAFAVNVANEPGLDLLTITTVIVCLMSLVGVFASPGIYKSQWIAMLDALFMLNLVMLCAATYYCQLSGGKQEVVGYTSLGVAFLTFVGILIYHLHMQVKDTAFGKKLSKKWRNICNTQYNEDQEVDLILDRD